MKDKPLVTRSNRSTSHVIESIIGLLVIGLWTYIIKFIQDKTTVLKGFDYALIFGIWIFLLILTSRTRKLIQIFPEHIIVKYKSGKEIHYSMNRLYLNIVKYGAGTVRSKRTFQLREKGTHKKIFNVEPIDDEDDNFLENLLKNECKIKVDNWVE